MIAAFPIGEFGKTGDTVIGREADEIDHVGSERRIKVKSRPGGPEAALNASGATALASETLPIPPVPPQTVASKPKIAVRRSSLDVFNTIFERSGVQRGSIRFQNFRAAMAGAGCTIREARVGSAVDFTRGNDALSVHQPHDGSKAIEGAAINWYRKRLRDRLGWNSDTFYCGQDDECETSTSSAL